MGLRSLRLTQDILLIKEAHHQSMSVNWSSFRPHSSKRDNLYTAGSWWHVIDSSSTTRVGASGVEMLSFHWKVLIVKWRQKWLFDQADKHKEEEWIPSVTMLGRGIRCCSPTQRNKNTNTMTLRYRDTKTQGHLEIHRHKEAHKQYVQYGGHVHRWSIVLKRTLGHKKHLLRETKQERTYSAKRGTENQSWLSDTVYPLAVSL